MDIIGCTRNRKLGKEITSKKCKAEILKKIDEKDSRNRGKELY